MQALHRLDDAHFGEGHLLYLAYQFECFSLPENTRTDTPRDNVQAGRSAPGDLGKLTHRTKHPRPWWFLPPKWLKERWSGVHFTLLPNTDEWTLTHVGIFKTKPAVWCVCVSVLETAIIPKAQQCHKSAGWVVTTCRGIFKGCIIGLKKKTFVFSYFK